MAPYLELYMEPLVGPAASHISADKTAELHALGYAE